MKMTNNIVDQLAVARRIRAAGRPIHIAEDDGEVRRIPSNGLRVYQTGGALESCAIDYPGGTAFMIRLIITVNLPKFAISAFGLELPWKDDSFHWLEDPLEIDGESRCYRFGSKDLPVLERRDVLNHMADVRRIFSRGESLKGSLLGCGLESIPEKFQRGMKIPAFVVVYDQFGLKGRFPVELYTDRSLVRPRVPKKRNLLDHPDRITRD